MDPEDVEGKYQIDGNTELEFLSRKTVVVIDKDQFYVCKQLMIENAPDEEYASFLNIPLEKVRYFKYKMQLFEDSIRTRRRAAKLEKQRKKAGRAAPIRKREISSEERFRRARDLISRNLSTNQISNILKVSERSVTRFKRRMREEKQRLKAEGKIALDPNDPDDENSFRHLPPEEKMKKAELLFRKRLKIQEISEILKISERSVRRWKDKLGKLKNENASIEDASQDEIDGEQEILETKPQLRRVPASKRPTIDDEYVEGEEENIEEATGPAPKKRRMLVDREKAQYAKELIDNKLSNKEMSMLLEMSIACVRKLKMKILNGTVDELIDNSEEHYIKFGKKAGSSATKDPDSDPLHCLESYYANQPAPSTSSAANGSERKPKVVLSDRDMFICRLLRDNNVRTMDIAKMMKISERSVTRLLARSKEKTVLEFDDEVVAEVERMIAEKDELLNSELADNLDESFAAIEPQVSSDDAKRQLGVNLLAMNVKIKDIAKMLDVNERTVQRWKVRMQNEQRADADEVADDDVGGHSVFEDIELEVTKQEYFEGEEYEEEIV